MPRIVQAALVLLSCALFATEVFAQSGQVTNPVPLTAPSVNTTTTTCQINCDQVPRVRFRNFKSKSGTIVIEC
jgi:hypothetical protein